MKKVLSVLLALTMVLSLAACGKKAAEETTEAAEAPATAVEILEKTWAEYSES